MTTISKAIRNHLHFFLIAPALVIVMTWPTIAQVFNGDVLWLPTRDPDYWLRLWDAWYARLVFAGEADFLFTDKLFYPQGLSLAFHIYNAPHMLGLIALQQFLPDANAFNLIYLIIAGANVAAAYLYLLYLFRDKWVGLIGAVIFGLHPFILSHPQHPELNFVAVLPLSLYFLDRGIREEGRKWLALAGVFMGSTVFMSMYIFICLSITAAMFILYRAKSFGRRPEFWRGIILLGAVFASISMVRLYPMLMDADGLGDALSKNSEQQKYHELLDYFVNRTHPIAGGIFADVFNVNLGKVRDGGYLGYLPLLLLLFGIIRARDRRKLMPWCILLLFFVIMRLGSTLRVHGIEYDSIRLPKYYLEQWFPPIFQPFWSAENFHIGVLLPFAVLASYGLQTLQQSIAPNRRGVVVLAICALVAFEYYQVPETQELSSQAWAFLGWLRQEEDQDQIHLIHLPMGRQVSKLYGYYQTLSGYPHVEGLASRTPSSAYRYIEKNLLLKSWNKGRTPPCAYTSQEAYRAAIERLLLDGFTHIVYHPWREKGETIMDSFLAVPTSYRDEFTRIYRLRDLLYSCRDFGAQSQAARPHLAYLARSDALIPDRNTAILSIGSARKMDERVFAYFSPALSGWKAFVHLYVDGDDTGVQSSVREYADLDSILSASSVILLAHDPGEAEPQALDSHLAAIKRSFTSCPPITQSEETVIAYYAREASDCALLSSQGALAVRYDNRIQLGNLLYHIEGNQLHLKLWWRRLPREAHAISIQIFDEAGEKVHGQDYVIGQKQLADYQINLSSLEPGTYLAKLILYNFDTGASVPGTVTSAQSRFDRELEIGRIPIE